MCGIFGYIGKHSGRLSHFIISGFIESEDRGKDASGYFARDNIGNTIDDKRPIRATKFVKRANINNRFERFRPSCVIGHCRYATSNAGNANQNRNNHPFIGKHIAIVHNGIIQNHKTWPAFNKLQLTTETDSEVILRYLESKIDEGKTITEAIIDFSSVVSDNSKFAVACVCHKTGNLFLFRNNERPLHIAKLDDAWAFASTSAILHKSLKNSNLRFINSSEIPEYGLKVIQSNGETYFEPIYKPKKPEPKKQGFIIVKDDAHADESKNEDSNICLESLKDDLPGIHSLIGFVEGIEKNYTPTREELRWAMELIMSS